MPRDDTQQVPKRPKLRSTCDGCGAAKVRCDRRQPECARCISHDMACVYGISRKMGKPRREKLRPTVDSTSSDQVDSTDAERLDSGGCSSNSSINGLMLDLDPFSHIPDAMATWETVVHDSPNALMANVEALDNLTGDFSALLPSTNYYCSDLGEWSISDHLNDNALAHNPQPEPPIPALDPPTLAEASSSTDPTMTLGSDGFGFLLPLAIKSHDCFGEAHDIIESLSSRNMKRAHLPIEGIPNQVPLDHVLNLNGKASERLNKLLTCSCAKYPHLSLLYASIISRVLQWYSQVACCSQTPPCSPATTSMQSPDGTTSVPIISAVGCAVTPTKMAIGIFNVNDIRVQTALKLQLLLGEMRKICHLIDQFNSYCSSDQSFDKEPSPDGAESLRSSLSTWLKSEHSRIVDEIKTRLAGINT